MTKQSLEDRIADLDPDKVDFTDPATWANLIPDADPADGGAAASNQSAPGDTAAPAAAHATAASAPAAPAPAPAATAPAAAAPAPAPAVDPSAAPTAGPAQDGYVAGVLTADGKSVIPYTVLKSTRDQLRDSVNRNVQLERELDEARKAASTSQEALAAAQADPASLTPEQIALIESDFPQLAAPLKVMQEQAKVLKQIQAAQAQAPAPAPAHAPAPAPATAESDDEAFDRAIAANSLIGEWMGNKDSKQWQRAVALDAVLAKDPENADYATRFSKVQAMVCAEFGIANPNQQKPAAGAVPAAALPGAPAAAPAQPAATPAVQSAALPTLSDIGGAPPKTDTWADLSDSAAMNKAMDMSEEQLMQLAGVSF
ncbi:MAG: hypothetical protein WAQ08_16105 [Aquabacterium sp.]|uniref:hypothetical protein n=1 Tax=Aquabacterium sp. TaxID=1872578 RepID=UPI003BB0261C